MATFASFSVFVPFVHQMSSLAMQSSDELVFGGPLVSRKVKTGEFGGRVWGQDSSF